MGMIFILFHSSLHYFHIFLFLLFFLSVPTHIHPTVRSNGSHRPLPDYPSSVARSVSVVSSSNLFEVNIDRNSTNSGSINRTSLIPMATLMIGVSLVVSPYARYLWVATGSVNANFLFFPGMMLWLGLALLVIQSVKATKGGKFFFKKGMT